MANTIDLRQKRETIKLQMKDMVARAEAAADDELVSATVNYGRRDGPVGSIPSVGRVGEGL